MLAVFILLLVHIYDLQRLAAGGGESFAAHSSSSRTEIPGLATAAAAGGGGIAAGAARVAGAGLWQTETAVSASMMSAPPKIR